MQAKATTLATTGVYLRIRNPIYFFGAMSILGVIIWMGTAVATADFCGPDSTLQVLRIRKEERVVTEKFGAAYLDYKPEDLVLMRLFGS